MTGVVLLAAGQSSRMGPEVTDKILARVGDCSVFACSANAFASSDIAEVVVVVHRDAAQLKALRQEVDTKNHLPKVIWAKGGRQRSDSVRKGLQALPKGTKAVFIHDCARPLVRAETLRSINEALSEYPAVALAKRLQDTVKSSQSTKKEGVFVTRSLDRESLWAMETPQAFELDLIQKAYAHAQEKNLPLTDDVSAVEALGHPVRLMEARYPNPKITTEIDLLLVENLLSSYRK